MVLHYDKKEVSREEAMKYVEFLELKHNKKVKELTIEIDGDDAILNYEFEPIPFERIRRITGYLVGSTNKWNDSKKAELDDRVSHSLSEKEKVV